MLVSELETPAVLVDLDVMERNLTRMAEYCSARKIRLRPHTKSHKIPELAELQIQTGAMGITVAKLAEAEVMLSAGSSNILIAYPIVGRLKATRLACLAERVNLEVSLDSEEAARAISDAANAQNVKIGVLVELDVGFRRCGLANATEVLALARKVSTLPGLEFRGLMFFPGHFMVSPDARASLLGPVNSLLDRTFEVFEQAKIPLSTISGGSTPTAYDAHLFHGVNEIRPGMYIFNDRNLAGIGVARVEDCALSVVVTVVSTSVYGRSIIDGGSKTFSSDRFLGSDAQGFGFIKEDPEARLESLSEEHGHIDIKDSTRRYRVGERLTIIPNHVCSTVNMHDEIYGVRAGRVEKVWKVSGRGKVR